MSSRKPPPVAGREVALFRYSLVRPLLDPRLTPAERGQLVRSLAERQHVGPAGELVWVSRATVDRWTRTLRLEGFQSLVPRPRQVSARTAAAALEAAVALKRERPARTATQVARIMRERDGRGPSARTLQRHFARLGLHRDPEAVGQPQVFGRFEADFCDELWISDGLHAGAVRGPVIDGHDTVLVAILDDHSRYIVHAHWGYAEDTLALQAVLHDAVKIHGCPVAFYCDHGSAYTSNQLAWSLAVLDVKIIHSRVGQPQGRGKLERWNRTCREEFLVEVDTGTGVGGSSVASLAELNQLFQAWLHHSYHQRVHSETGQTPAARYHHRDADTPQPRRPGTQQLWRAFRWRESRKVTSWRAVSLLGNNYEVDAALVGYEVDLLFNPFDLEHIEVEYHGRPMGVARPHKIARHVHPDVKAPAKKPPAQPTGIDYLRLLETAQQAELGQAIRFDLLADTVTATSTDEPSTQPTAKDASTDSGADDEPGA